MADTNDKLAKMAEEMAARMRAKAEPSTPLAKYFQRPDRQEALERYRVFADKKLIGLGAKEFMSDFTDWFRLQVQGNPDSEGILGGCPAAS